MNISTNYDYYLYNQYINNRTVSVQGQQGVYTKENSQTADSVQTVADASAQISPGTKRINPLDSLVESETITEEQEEAIRNALEKAKLEFKTQASAANSTSTYTDPLESLVESGTITEEQAASVKSTLDSARNAGRMPPPPKPPVQKDENSDQLSSTLDSLVTDGTITSEQKDTVLSALESALKSYEEETDEESDPLESLVESGIITEEEKEAVKSALQPDSKVNRMPPPPPPEEDEEDEDTIDSILDSLVESETITEEQEEAISTAFESDIQVNRMPPPPPPAQKENDDTIESTLDSLVTDGKITSDQQEAILSALQSALQSNQEETDEESDGIESTAAANQQSTMRSVYESAIKAYQEQAYAYNGILSNYLDEGM